MDIPIPNSLYLKTQNTHCDSKSEDPHTGAIQAKYKVCAAILKDFGLYSFFVSTTRETSCPKDFVVVVETQDWIDRVNGHLEKPSYLSATHVDILADREIMHKRNDPHNYFMYVGKLPDNKYNELIIKYRQNRDELKPRDQEAAGVAFSNILRLPVESIERILENLNISKPDR